MNATIYTAQRKSSKNKELSALLAEFRIENERHRIAELRKEHPLLRESLPKAYAERIPHVGFTASYTSYRGIHRYQAYNGWVLLHVNSLSGTDEATTLAREARNAPQTVATFVGCSGQSLKLIVAFCLPDGSLPQSEELATLFHAHACRQAARYYSMQLSREVTFRSDRLNATCRFTFDPQTFYRPEPLPIRMEQPTSLPQAESWLERSERESDPLRRIQSNFKREESVATLFQSALRDALQIAGEPDEERYRQRFLTCLAARCNQAGIPQEDAICSILDHNAFRPHEQEVRQTMGNAYRLEGRFGTRKQLPPWQQLTLDLDEFIHRRYELRFNTIRLQNEYRQRRSFHHSFRLLDERALNTLSLEAQQEGINVWDRDVKRYINSNKVPLFDPIDHYLRQLPAWDGTDHIARLAETLPCANPTAWHKQFHRWFLGMVAGWQSNWKPQANSTLPLLVGKQGCGKSTWCRNLLPRELHDYYTDSIDFAKRQEANLSLTRFALINIDEFDSVSSSYHGFLKHVIQKPLVNSRKPHQSHTVALRRYASFMATCNNFDLLTDPTGSRRFLCVEITGTIDRDYVIDHPQLYAQAKAQLAMGERSWFDHEEEAQISHANTQFESQPLEEQLFHTYFRKPEEGEMGEWLTALEIILALQKLSGVKLGNKRLNHFGRILKKLNLEVKRKNSGRFHFVIRHS